MRYYELDEEEKEILDAAERDELVQSKDKEAIEARMIEAAKNFSSKTKNINLRLPERTIYKLKAKALREGLPYQTLAASILHKNAD